SGKRPEAAECFGQALIAGRELGDRYDEAVALGSLGDIYLADAEFHQAVAVLDQAISIAKELRHERLQRHTLGNLRFANERLASAYCAAGEYALSIEHFVRAVVFAQELGDRDTEMRCLGQLGNAHLMAGQPRHAVETFEQLVQLTQDLKDRRKAA